MKDTPHEKARENILQNAQKGEIYRLKFEGDATMYTGMPIALPGITGEDDEVFEFRILEPEEKAGVQRRSIHEIAWLEKSR